MSEPIFYALDVNRVWALSEVFDDLLDADWRVDPGMWRTGFRGPERVTHPARMERVELTVFVTEATCTLDAIRERLARDGLRLSELREGAAFALRHRRECLASGPLLLGREVMGLMQPHPWLPRVSVPAFCDKRKPRFILAPFDTSHIASGVRFLCAKL